MQRKSAVWSGSSCTTDLCIASQTLCFLTAPGETSFPYSEERECGTKSSQSTNKPSNISHSFGWFMWAGILRNEDATPMQSASVQVVDGIESSSQRVGDGMQRNFALRGQRHQLGQIIIPRC